MKMGFSVRSTVICIFSLCVASALLSGTLSAPSLLINFSFYLSKIKREFSSHFQNHKKFKISGSGCFGIFIPPVQNKFNRYCFLLLSLDLRNLNVRYYARVCQI